MAQVIIYTHPTNGNVCVCNPAPGMDINQVMQTDVPSGVTDAKIVDHDTALPIADYDFFNAWKLTAGVVAVDMPTAAAMTHAAINKQAAAVAQQRTLNSTIGVAASVLPIGPQLTAIRSAVNAATTTAQLRAAMAQVPTA